MDSHCCNYVSVKERESEKSETSTYVVSLLLLNISVKDLPHNPLISTTWLMPNCQRKRYFSTPRASSVDNTNGPFFHSIDSIESRLFAHNIILELWHSRTFDNSNDCRVLPSSIDLLGVASHQANQERAQWHNNKQQEAPARRSPPLLLQVNSSVGSSAAYRGTLRAGKRFTHSSKRSDLP